VETDKKERGEGGDGVIYNSQVGSKQNRLNGEGSNDHFNSMKVRVRPLLMEMSVKV